MVRSMILQQNVVEIGTNRNFSRPAGQAAVKGDSSPAEVHVAAFQLNRLAKARAGSIEKQEQCAKGASADHGVQSSLSDPGGDQQPSEFRPRINVRHKCLCRKTPWWRQRQSVDLVVRFPVAKELA